MMDQLALDIPVSSPAGEEPGPATALEESPFPHVRTGGVAPRNVLVERADGTRDVRPVRLLRVRCPC